MSRPSLPLSLLFVALLALPAMIAPVGAAGDPPSVSVTILETPQVQTGTLAKVFMLADGEPAAGSVTFHTQYVLPTKGYMPMKTFTVTVGSEGEATFVIPRDLPGFNVPGQHVLIGVANIGGVTARMSLAYEI